MQRKNNSFLPVIAFICAVILSFQSLIAVYRSPGKRLAAARQSSSYPTTQKSIIVPISAAAEEEKIRPIFTQEKKLEEKKDAQTAQEIEKIEEEEPTIEDQVQLPPPTGFLSKAYALVTPLILVTLNAGIGIAIEAGTKSLIKGFGSRPLLLEEKVRTEEAIIQIQSEWPEKYPDAIKENRLDLNFIPEKERKKWIKNNILLEKLDQNSSYSYIFSKAAYTFMVYTIFSTIAKITGYSVSTTLDALLQSVSPISMQQSKQRK